MNVQFKPLGITQQELDYLVKLGLKYDKRQKKQMLAAATVVLPSEEEVRSFERKHKFSLPPDYKEFLLEKNGGVPDKSLIDVPSLGERVVRRCFALKGAASSYTLDYIISVYKGRVPTGMLPIGDDPAGNLFLIELSEGEDYGRIYFWDHEQEADMESQPYRKNIYKIAANFAFFLQSLM